MELVVEGDVEIEEAELAVVERKMVVKVDFEVDETELDDGIVQASPLSMSSPRFANPRAAIFEVSRSCIDVICYNWTAYSSWIGKRK